MDYSIRLLSGREEADILRNFLSKFPLDYPDYFSWLDRCRPELESGQKKAYYAYRSDSGIVGSIIFQVHKQQSHILEVKNLRVAQEFRGNGIGSVLEFMAEHYGRESGLKEIQADTHVDNREAISFLVKMGYYVLGRQCLYTNSREEMVLSKPL
ncbi:MAG: GNAT family N-acetyltransferase [Nanoarchaeota archaeon]